MDELLDDIETKLHTKPKKNAPPYFNRYGKGMRYATFRKNKQTQWYVFFSSHEDENGLVYLIRHISNNHVDAKHLG